MKRWCSLLLAALTLLLLCACGGSEEASGLKEPAREKVTVALWSDQLTEQYGQYLQETFPEVDFEFYVATNSTDFYRFKEARGDLPDILTVRRFALRDVAEWKDALLDLSDCELAGSFHQSYLRSYTYDDGTVNWLPACGEVDSILINRTLLKEHGLEVPANYQEFVDTCGALAALDIRPFQSNFGADYTCMEMLQGLSISQLVSQKGREWRNLYESGRTDQLSEAVWLPAFQRLEEFIHYAGITPEDLTEDTAAVFGAYRAGKTAMIRGTSGEASRYGAETGSVMMPYYGETENWYLTYPAFQAAASVRAEESPEREELIVHILEAMLNQEGLRHIATGRDMIAYREDAELELSPLLSNMPHYLERNRLYIRLASSDMFAASEEVVQGMITGKYPDARAAFRAFNQAMENNNRSRQAPYTGVSIDRSYSYAFSSQGGSPAASAVMNSLREELGAQLLVGQASNVAGNIAAGDYSEEELQFLTMGESVDMMRCQITGEQLYSYLERLLSASGRRGCVCNDSTLYVSSGFEMELRRTEEGYALEKLTAGGRELDRMQTYDLVVLGNELMLHKELLEGAGITQYTKEETPFKQLIAGRLMEGRQLAAPTDYITLR